MFQFMKGPSSGSYKQCLAKITSYLTVRVGADVHWQCLYQHALLNKTCNFS